MSGPQAEDQASTTQQLVAAVRQRYEGSAAQEAVEHLRQLDFSNQAILLGAGLLASLLPLLILLSAFAGQKVDDDIALRLGLDHRAEGVLARLFSSAPASVNAATVTSLIFVMAGMLAVASSLQQTYEKVFDQEPRGMRELPRLIVWILVLVGVIAFESVVERPARGLPGGSGLAVVVTFAIFTPFFWWTMHFLLAGRVPFRRLLPSAIATGLLYAGLAVFSELYFSSTILSDSTTYGSIGAVFGILTWLIAVGAVIVLGAVAGAVWPRRERPPLLDR